MRAVKSRGTSPELVVRRILYAEGYRYRLHSKNLPGKPDLVFPRRRKVVFVHGCFWHGHDCARGARVPVHNRAYWKEKIARNRGRDQRVRASLKVLGWSVYVVWECELRDIARARSKLRRFFSYTRQAPTGTHPEKKRKRDRQHHN